MDHQDWNTIYTHVNKKLNNDKKSKQKKGISKEKKMEKQIEEGKMKVKLTSSDIGKQIQDKRNSKGLSQKDLAQKVSVVPKIIIEIESGKAKHNPQLINKINRILNSK